jgi:mRNA interferase MazF
MRRGEIWWVRLPPSDGHEQAGERPAIILQDDAFIATLPMVLIVPLTGALHAARFPGTLVIQPDPRNGLLRPSVALVFQMRALDKHRFLRRMGELDAATLSQIWALLDNLLGR